MAASRLVRGATAGVAKGGPGGYDIKLPDGVSARSFLPNGTKLIADMAGIAVKQNGSVRTAFFYNSASMN